MDIFSFTSIVVILIIVVGSYLVFTDTVEGRAKIILIVFVGFFGIMLFSSLSIFKSYVELTDGPIPANVLKTITADKLGQVTTKYSVSTWIYINDWNTNFGNIKDIIKYKRGTDDTGVPGSGNFKIQLDSTQNDLKIFIPLQSATNGTASATGSTITIPNISIQKWVNIIVCVSENNADVYINGKLVNSTKFTTISLNPTTQNQLDIASSTNGFNGSISGTRFYNKFLNPQESYNIYNEGFSNSLLGSFMNRYNASIVFYKDRQTINEINFM